ncbi:magnesium-translocating P-type ATPase [Streptomyces turgidiscabies]|uniref:Magnesium-transporting ATPase, P-type 1 n=1 Tax=Streptomyces turgidiscabies (strain Car8) TaxID=698760 RepID=L7F7B9_STRT8|nr:MULTISPECIES: magnesium-translocating P-type ATPase [Streptomyces]ELP67498.1 magnesium-importing ATPase [Streptomyces turgidiscabies Car8]MDX3495098.1 magnesium-translocating P-type ATPase [Streptomyces turgidiscabies]GAQ70971.1 magnesium-transporting ATPase, P-type 1 [Streptomyces turgidiscabies]
MESELLTPHRLDSLSRALTDTEAEARAAAFGENVVPSARPVGWPVRFVRSLRDPFTAVLLCLGLVSAAVTAWGTAAVILFLVAVSCVLRASGEHQAERFLRGLRELVAGTATVLRRPQEGGPPLAREIPVAELVPGDVIRLGAGDLVPADVRLLRAAGLTVHQAPLTGESAPVAKDARPGAADRGVFARPELCFQGSAVASGSATAVVVATGARTQFAGAHRTVAARDRSDFDRSLHGISWVLIRFMLLAPPLVLMASGALRRQGPETLPFAVAVAVGLTPAMLPVVVGICLARAASGLARAHGVVVKRLPALHDLGAVDVLCVDKTGTLTRDRPVVERSTDAAGRDDPQVLDWAATAAWWTLQLAEPPTPDALDEALLTAAGPVGERYDGVAALPFDPVRRLTTAVVRGRLGTHVLVVKGAVADVVERCALDAAERARLLSRADGQAASGLRLLAVATAERPARTREWTPADVRDLTFRGFVALRDDLAPTAAAALRDLAALGVDVKILTGDHPGTAARACHDLGLDPGEVVDADAVAGLGDAELTDLARRTTVFARCAPAHKARIVAALRAGGHTVGFLGDGTNDVPALGAADVGIAPRAAVDVARESADVILGDSGDSGDSGDLGDRNLAAVAHAVTAGRHSSGNIATYLRVTLSSNLGNVAAMLAAGLLLPFLPMLPAQVLAQNLCFDAAQLAYAYDRPAPGALARPTAVRPRELLRFLGGFGALNAVADLATFGVLALALHGPDALDDRAVFHSAWFTENLLTQAVVMLLLRGGGGRIRGAVGRAAAGLAAVGLLLPLSSLGPPLGLVGLPGSYYALRAVVLGLYGGALAVARRWPFPG